MNIEVVMTVVALLVGAVFIVLLYRKRKNEHEEAQIAFKLTIDRLINDVKIQLGQLNLDIID